MRTPGRCTNLVGCWIGSTQRDVWLSIGEDFACPNCGSTLTPPPRRSFSSKSLKKVATTGVALSMGLAAMAFGGVKLSTIKWDATRQIVASRPRPSVQTFGHAPVRVAELAAPSHRVAALATTPLAAPAIQPRMPPQIVQEDVAPVRPSSPSVLDFISNEGKAPRTDKPLAVARVENAGSADDEAELPTQALVTMVSEAALVVPENARRTLVLPLSWGEPPAPEDDTAPVSRSWHAHGIARMQHSYFLPAPGGPTIRDALGQICRTPGYLR